MEHDLPVAKCLVQRVDARLAKLRVQTSTVPNHQRKQQQILLKTSMSIDRRAANGDESFPISTYMLISACYC
jgi:hypothetical protein